MKSSLRSPTSGRTRSQYTPMSEAEAWSFLKNHYTMILSTVDSLGFPHVTPVWYVIIDGKIYFRAQAYKKKIRNLLKKPQIAAVVEDGERYTELRGVMFQGVARIVDHDKTKRKLVFAMLAEKYQRLRDTDNMPKMWREKFGKEHRLVVEVMPTRIVSWDNRKWVEPSRP
jgi:PPOX class probable F420-dependent enzyme